MNSFKTKKDYFKEHAVAFFLSFKFKEKETARLLFNRLFTTTIFFC